LIKNDIINNNKCVIKEIVLKWIPKMCIIIILEAQNSSHVLKNANTSWFYLSSSGHSLKNLIIN